MKIAVTGATGRVGYGVAAHLLGRGHRVTALGRGTPTLSGVESIGFALDGPLPVLAGFDALVHAAFSHLPGRYRGGEGDDPVGFRRSNLDGTLRLFEHARAAGVARIVFLSSRAVYDGYPDGTPLSETLPPRPRSLYGKVKAEAEEALAAMAGDGLVVASLRATGIYGPAIPGHPHKWADLFAAFERGEQIPPRIGAEIHVGDVASAVALLLTAGLDHWAFNASDIVLDRRDLLGRYAALAGRAGTLPMRADPSTLSVMETGGLQRLGWRPRGMEGLDQCLRGMIG